MYIQTNIGLGQVTTTLDINKAIRNNRIYRQQLGWQLYYDNIIRFLGFTTKPSEPELAQGVAQWQQSQGFKADGILGPSTWKAFVDSGVKEVGLPLRKNITPADPQATQGWQGILPHARPRKGKEKFTELVQNQGEEPRLRYIKSALEVVPTQASRTEIALVVNAIRSARDKLIKREIGRSLGKGNFYDPVDAAKKGDEKAKSYNSWIATARPTDLVVNPGSTSEQDWRLFKQMEMLEGRIGTITTRDGWLTVGVGFSSAGGEAEAIIDRALQKSLEAVGMAKEAGFAVQRRKFQIVDPDFVITGQVLGQDEPVRGIVLEGTDAQNYVCAEPTLLSLIVNLSQGFPLRRGDPALSNEETNRRRQAWLDSQWESFKGVVDRMPGSVRKWPDKNILLAAHAHLALSGTFSWDFLASHGPELSSLGAAIWEHLRINFSLSRACAWMRSIFNGPYQKIGEFQLRSERLTVIRNYQWHLEQVRAQVNELMAKATVYPAGRNAIQNQIDEKLLDIDRLRHELDQIVKQLNCFEGAPKPATSKRKTRITK